MHTQQRRLRQRSSDQTQYMTYGKYSGVHCADVWRTVFFVNNDENDDENDENILNYRRQD